MSQLKVNTIRHTGASSDAITLASDGTCTAKISNNLSNRNLVINGAFNVAQRATSSTTTGYATVDRWEETASGTDEACTKSQHVLTSSDTGPWEKGFRYSFMIQNGNQTSGAGAADWVSMRYKIEAQDLAQSGWDYTSASSYITLSFWVKSSVAQTFYGYIRTIDGTEQNYSFSLGSLSANTWTKVTKTIPGNSNITLDNNNMDGVRIFIAPFYGTDRTDSGNTLNTWAAYSSSSRTPDNTATWYTTNDATFEITGVQLEVGSAATPFEHRSYADEFQKCLRYYFEIGNTTNSWMYLNPLAHNNSTVEIIPVFPVPMRTGPTVSSTGTINCRACANGNSGSEITLSGSAFSAPETVVTGHTWWSAASGTPFSGGYFGRIYGGTSTSSINFSAEL